MSVRAARIVAPRQVQLVETPLPEPGSGQVRVKIEGSGVCGSNLPTWEGKPWFDYPLAPGAPGHEGWGCVDAVGRDVTTVAAGDRVAFLSGHAFAEFDLCDADQVVPLPRAIDGLPFPAEPLGCAMNVFRRSDVREGDRIAIVGVGFLGAVLTRLASAAGARVTVLSRRPYSREVGRRMGAEAAYPLDDESVGRARADTGDRGYDRVIEAVGLQRTLDIATALTRVRGRLIVGGFHQDGQRTIDMRVWNWHGIDVINAHERDPAVYRQGMQAAVEAVSDGVLDLDALLTHRYALEDLDCALDDLARRPEGFLKGVVLT